MRTPSPASGFSLIETVIAMGVLATGMLGAAAVLSAGLGSAASSPGDLIALNKATEAIESVFSARDSHVVPWAQLRNVRGASGHDGGIILDGPQPLRLAGADGLVNTADDSTITLNGYTRSIAIADVAGETDGNGVSMLRAITVTVVYQSGPTRRTCTLTTYISSYS